MSKVCRGETNLKFSKIATKSKEKGLNLMKAKFQKLTLSRFQNDLSREVGILAHAYLNFVDDNQCCMPQNVI